MTNDELLNEEISRMVKTGEFFGPMGAIERALDRRNRVYRFRYENEHPAFGGEGCFAPVSMTEEDYKRLETSADIAYASVLYSAAGYEKAMADGLRWCEAPIRKLRHLHHAALLMLQACLAVGFPNLEKLNPGQLNVLASIYRRFGMIAMPAHCCEAILKQKNIPVNDRVLAATTLAEIQGRWYGAGWARETLESMVPMVDRCDPVTQIRFYRTQAEVFLVGGLPAAALESAWRALQIALANPDLHDQLVKADALVKKLRGGENASSLHPLPKPGR